jgi:light-regulated signal transduction histidine kinase (bacteriophytochrome)
LAIAIDNLVSNAWKYTGKTEHAVIEFGTRSQDGKSIYYLKDNGAGFDAQHADKIFNAFQRLHTAQEFEGSGIGLAIVLRIVNRHGGKIWTDARPNGGAVFYFTLPDGN